MKQFLLYAALVAALGTGVYGLAGLRSSEPVSHGRSLAAWLPDLSSSDYHVHDRAAFAIQAAGPSAVPALVRGLQKKDTRLSLFLEAAGQRWPQLHFLEADRALLRERSAEQLGIIGERGAPAMTILIPALDDDRPGVVSEVQRALRRISQHGPLLPLQGLVDANPLVRARTAEVLSDLGSRAKPAVPALVGALADPEEDVRHSAARALGATAAGEAIAVPALVRALNDPAGRVRGASAEALGEIGAVAQTAVPALVEKLKDPEVAVRVAAAKALWQLEHRAEAVVPVLVQALEDPTVRWHASFVLGEIGPEAAGAVPALVRVLQRERVPRALRAPPSSAIALGQIGRPAVPELIRCLHDERPVVRTAAAIALGLMGRAAETAIPALLQLLTDHDQEVRQASVLSLGAIGSKNPELVPALVKMMSDDDVFLRGTAAAVLQKLDPDTAAKVRVE